MLYIPYVDDLFHFDVPISYVIPQWFTAVYTGLVAAIYTCLLINAFVGFQFAEDGTPLSLWVRFYAVANMST